MTVPSLYQVMVGGISVVFSLHFKTTVSPSLTVLFSNASLNSGLSTKIEKHNDMVNE